MPQFITKHESKKLAKLLFCKNLKSWVSWEKFKTMAQSLKASLAKKINFFLGLLKLKLIRLRPYTDYRDYIPFERTIVGAKEAGLSVGDYIDLKHNKPGATQDTIERLDALKVFEGNIERVCEIGPGSGRYLEKVIKKCSPDYYEIYETAKVWEKWLVEQYQLKAQPTDGKSLASTPSESIDLVQAHKVLSGQPSLVLCRYLQEMARVTRTGGKIVFDIVTEECFDEETLKNWLDTGRGYQHYPCLVPKQFAINLLERHGCNFVGSFFVPMKPGKTECMVFVKKTN